MTTSSSGTIVWPDEGVHSSHSALPHSDEPPVEGANASGRARAREYAPDSAQSQPDDAVDADDPRVGTVGDALSQMREVFLDAFTPPDIVATDRPCLQRLWSYAAKGEWTGEEGLPRGSGKVYAAVVAQPVTAVLYLLAWIVERPTRLAAAALLYGLVSQFLPLPLPTT